MSQIDEIASIVSGYAVQDEPMADHTTLGVGGPADYFVDVASEDELCALMNYISANGLPWASVSRSTECSQRLPIFHLTTRSVSVRTLVNCLSSSMCSGA